ncbi:MAG: MoaD/ThiS family protein [Crocinitomix sp.]|jgi:molybdopterin synthase sulfur carrier subunit|nr:MoaD/ThiS family protein [Crocinitomix sp.]
MNVTVLFFGMLAEVTQTSVLELNTNSMHLTDFQNEVLNLFPDLKKMSFKIAVNEKIVEEDVPLTAFSKIAFLPPFAGG